jgi:NADH dehydrogenase
LKNIVILGAGYAGILTAKKLAKKFRKDDTVHITIIDKNPFHTMLTELHEVAAGRVDEDSIKISLAKVFAGRKVDVRLDTAVSIDYDNKTVNGVSNNYPYDYLVLAAGSKPTYYGIPGAEEHSFKLWSFDDAVLLKNHILDIFRKASRMSNEADRRKLLTFYIVGAGFTGVEMAGELAEYVPILCEKYEIERDEVTIVNADAMPRVVPILTEKLSAKVEKRLNKMGVEVMLNTNVCEVGKGYIELEKDGNVTRKFVGTVIWTAGIESADITEEAAKRLQSTKRGRIKTDAYCRSLDDVSIYIAGDNMFYIPEGENEPVPQMVENCEQCADIIAHNIFSTISGKGELKEYKPSFHGIMVSIGGRYGVARVGLPNRMINLPSFFAMFTKHFINIVYFVQVLGWNKVFSYLLHEFFTIRNRRSFVGGHFSNRTPSFLLMPLRVWLGAVWIFEGVMKVIGGWFSSPKLVAFFGGANAWYDSLIKGVSDGTSATTSATAAADAVTNATGAVADAVTGATGVAAQSAGEVIFNINWLGIFRTIFVCGTDPAVATLGDYAFKLDIPLLNWFIDTLILPYDGMQLFMQGFIVVAEILIGLALVSGLFTTPASAFSLVLQFMFVATTGLYLGTFWMIFAAVAVLIGGGRTLGLDYYVMPYLKRLWKRIPFVRKNYLYND